MNRLAPPSIYKNKVWHIRKKLNVESMKKGSKILLGTNDFSTFRASNCYSKTPIRTLEKVKIKKSDEKIIDGYLVNGLANLINTFSMKIRLFQSGYLYHYAFTMIISLVLFLLFFYDF